MAATKHRNDTPARTGRRPRLTAAARAQAQRDAFSRRVTRRAAHLLRYGPPQKSADDPKPSWENFPWNVFYSECFHRPVRGVSNVTGLPYVR